MDPNEQRPRPTGRPRGPSHTVGLDDTDTRVDDAPSLTEEARGGALGVDVAARAGVPPPEHG